MLASLLPRSAPLCPSGPRCAPLCPSSAPLCPASTVAPLHHSPAHTSLPLHCLLSFTYLIIYTLDAIVLSLCNFMAFRSCALSLQNCNPVHKWFSNKRCFAQNLPLQCAQSPTMRNGTSEQF